MEYSGLDPTSSSGSNMLCPPPGEPWSEEVRNDVRLRWLNRARGVRCGIPTPPIRLPVGDANGILYRSLLLRRLVSGCGVGGPERSRGGPFFRSTLNHNTPPPPKKKKKSKINAFPQLSLARGARRAFPRTRPNHNRSDMRVWRRPPAAAALSHFSPARLRWKYCEGADAPRRHFQASLFFFPKTKSGLT